VTEFLRALGAYCEDPSAAIAEALELPVPSAAQRAGLFLFQLYPNASVYLGAEGMLGGEAGDRVAGFWRAIGLRPPTEADHLAALLGLYAALAAEGFRARHPRKALLWEHLLSWLPAWLARIEELAPEGYRRWGRLLVDALLAEAEELGPPAVPPVHFRMTQAAAAAADILAPGPSGVILTRADLARAARDLNLGLRQGERRYALDALVAQAPQAVMAWLAAECRRQAGIHGLQPLAWRPVTDDWYRRANRTAQLFERLAREAGESWSMPADRLQGGFPSEGSPAGRST
jgi:hypothetical protein